MAEKFAVYSDLSARDYLTKPVELGKSMAWSAYYSIILDPGDTYVIPSTGDPSGAAVDKNLYYVVETATPGSADRTLRLPEASLDGQVLVIKRLDTEQSVINVVPFDGSDDIDGKQSVPLTFQGQTLILRSYLIGGGAYTWAILAAFKPFSAPMSFTFAGPNLGVPGGGNAVMVPAQLLAPPSQPVYAAISVLSNGAGAGTFTVNLATVAESLAQFVYNAGETGLKEMYLTGLPLTTNPLIAVGVVSSAGVDSADFAAIVTYCCSLET